MKHLAQELTVSIIFVVLLVLLLNPFHFWMPNALLMTVVLVLVLLFAAFASFVWRETARDEREELHMMRSGRIAFLAGAAALMLGIVIESINDSLDPWLVVALGIMILSKVSGLLYNKSNH